MFLLAHPGGEKEMWATQRIDYVMIKLSKTGGMYAKGTARWQKRKPPNKKKWMEFVKFTITEYERLQQEIGVINTGARMLWRGIHGNRGIGRWRTIPCGKCGQIHKEGLTHGYTCE